MATTGTTSIATCPARAALAGNPSDGHGGAVVATAIDRLRATVRVRTSDAFEIAGSPSTFRSVELLAKHLPTVDPDADRPLALAALIVLHQHLGAGLSPVHVEVDTTIPRSVGLAGSSAIVIATLRAVAAHHEHEPWATRLVGDPSLLASLALAAERDVLGIAAGLQDRVVQSFGGTVAMEFGEPHQRTIDGLEVGTYRGLPAPPGAMAIAFRPGSGSDSGAVHARVDRGDEAVAAAMHASAEQARHAATAIESRDRVALGEAMDATFDLRASVMDLDPRHVAMIELARQRGVSANYTGSGGAIVVLADDDTALAATCGALRDDLGCVTVRVP